MTVVGFLTILFVVLISAAFLFWTFQERLAKWNKNRASLNWPMAPARITESQITAAEPEVEDGAVRYKLRAYFEYTVGAATFDGNYEELLGSEAEVRQIDRSLKNGPLFARYNPEDPSDYFLDPYRDVRMLD